MPKAGLYFFAVMTFLVTAPASASELLEALQREIRIDWLGEARPFSLNLYFARKESDAAYYVGTATELPGDPFHWENLIYARVTEAKGGKLKLEVLREEVGLRIVTELDPAGAPGSPIGPLDAARIRVTDEVYSSEPDGGTSIYWLNHEIIGSVETPGLLIQQAPLTSADPSRQILGSVTIRSAIEFDPCDGCEHGDQFFISDQQAGLTVNVVRAEFGRYFTRDCPGEPHRWLDFLLEKGVPFTYVGRITALTSDSWEGLFWTAVEGGTLFLGTAPSPEYELVPFLDSLDPKGEFIDYRDGVLTFLTPDAEEIQIEL